MTDDDARQIVDSLAVGAEMEVPLSTPLFPDTRMVRSVLRREDAEHFVLRTTFCEFWAGHGWSTEQVEEERCDRATLLARVTSFDRAEFAPAAPPAGTPAP